jgi:predicted DNA binding CopG/RHH family protein
MAKLDKEEKDILDSVDAGEWLSVRGLKKESEKFQVYARETFRKDRRVNIRMAGRDLEAIQKRAMLEGIPYQTLIASILHKFAAGRLVDKDI